MKTKAPKRRKVSAKRVQLLASLQFPDAEICELLRCDADALSEFADRIPAWRSNGRKNIQGHIARHDKNGDAGMLALLRGMFPGIEDPENNKEKQDSDT